LQIALQFWLGLFLRMRLFCSLLKYSVWFENV
jgi:hypothetical protein